MKSTEKATQAACLDLLAAKRIFHYRQNSGGAMVAGNHFMRFGTPGAPDIVAVIGGQYIGIEVKDLKAKQNANQIKFQESLEKAGGRYLLVRTIDDLIQFLEKPV